MTKKMLIDATHQEETRVAVVQDDRLLEFDYESKFRKPLKGSIFLAKVTRVEPSLQAAFVNFGGNRHGFLPFSEIHPDYFRIPIADREALLAEQQAVIDEMNKEEESESSSEGNSEGGEGFENQEAASEGETIEEVADDKDSIEEIGGSMGFESSDAEGERAALGSEEPATEEEWQPEEPRGRFGRRGRGRARRPRRAMTSRNASDAKFGESQDLPEGEAVSEGEPLDETPLEAQGGEAGDDFRERSPDEGAFESQEGDAQNAEGGHNEESSSEPREEGSEGRNNNRGRRFNNNNRRGGGKFRGRGRQQRHGGHDSRQVESFGGEEYDDNGGDRFRYNLRRKYKIQEVIKRGQIMLVQVSKEERGNKGAAVSTYLSLPGRYCVLMPNSPRGGGVSRKIASYKDRARMREIVKELETPKDMSVIVRTAGVARTPEEIKRDLDYLMRLWDNIRELTLQSSAPSMVYGEADLIKRAVRDLYGRDIEEVVVAGHEGFETARNFMKMLVPTHTNRVQEYTGTDKPLFHKYSIEGQIAEIGEAQVTLPSGGYLVINQTEALVAIDVNSGRATKERHIEETAVKTNLEAAAEVARQLRLRDLGGLVVIDFIDMEDRRNNAKVERRMRDALSSDRARIQMGRISSFGLMELSRQRLNPSLNESQFELCKHCQGLGRVRTCDATSIMALRAIEEKGMGGQVGQVIAHVSNDVAIYILNNKRKHILDLEARYGFNVSIRVDENVGASSFRIEAVRGPAHAAEEGEGEGRDEALREEGQRLERSQVRDNREGAPAERHEGRHEHRGDRGGDDQSRRRGRRGGRGRNRNQNGRNENWNSGERDENFGNRQPEAQPPFDPADQIIDEVGNLPPELLNDESENFGNRQEFHGGDRLSADAPNRGGRHRQDRGGRGGQQRQGRGGRNNNNRGGRGRDGGMQGRGRRDNFNNAPQGDDNIGNVRPSSFDVADEADHFHAAPPAPKAQAPGADVVEKQAPRRPASSHSNDDKGFEHARAFEKVNEAPKEKKRGWWSKGTE